MVTVVIGRAPTFNDEPHPQKRFGEFLVAFKTLLKAAICTILVWERNVNIVAGWHSLRTECTPVITNDVKQTASSTIGLLSNSLSATLFLLLLSSDLLVRMFKYMHGDEMDTKIV